MSSSSSSIVCGRNIQHGGSLEYKGDVFSYSGEKSQLWTTWKTENLGRRFFGCPNFNVADCGIFKWHDAELSERAKNLLHEMKKENDALKRKIRSFKSRNNQEDELIEFKAEIIELKVEMKTTKDQMKRLNREKKMYLIRMCIAWSICMVGISGLLSN
ncbi:hypothetical protein V6N13_037441 [Hibiscus sabdariffa]|uniref:GRF-type domain-containing protein n=1 Tax=Hibiscus sabdariffa TaxID=183260 RepID=A0ABR2E8X1_9ROSI